MATIEFDREDNQKYVSRIITVTEDEITVVENYTITGTSSGLVALGLLPRINTQYEEDGVFLFSFVNNIEVNPTENRSPLTVHATVTYGKPESEKKDKVEPEADTATWSMSTQAQSLNIQKAFAQKHFPKGGFAAGAGGGGGGAGGSGFGGVNGDYDPTLDPGYSRDVTGGGGAGGAGGGQAAGGGGAGGGGAPAVGAKDLLTIGITKEGIEGVDVLRPGQTLKIVHWIPQKKGTPAFLDQIAALSGTVNKEVFAGPWGNWLTGEALYTGADISAPNDELLELSHTFIRSVNAKVDLQHLDKDKRVQQVTKGVDKKGWQYVWFQYGKFPGKDPVKDKSIDVIISSHLATVYLDKAFKELNLPKTFKSGEL